jgi:hypothetical protein
VRPDLVTDVAARMTATLVVLEWAAAGQRRHRGDPSKQSDGIFRELTALRRREFLNVYSAAGKAVVSKQARPHRGRACCSPVMPPPLYFGGSSMRHR